MSIPSKILNSHGDVIDGKEMFDKFVEILGKLVDFDGQNCVFKIKEIRNETYEEEPIIKYKPYKYSDYINSPQIIESNMPKEALEILQNGGFIE